MPVAARLVGAVHDDGIVGVAKTLGDVSPEHYPALAVILAAMVDPDKTPSELLAWVHWDDVPSETHDQPSLLALARDDDSTYLSADPREWTDEVCLNYHRLSRRTTLPEPRDYRIEIGAKEWDRRRARRRRAAS